MDRSEITPEQVSAARNSLNSEEQIRVDDQTIKRFLRACDGNLSQASQRLSSSLAWSLTEQPDRLSSCSTCTREPGSHYMHVVGHDAMSRPVIYSCLLVQNRVPEDTRVHMLHTFEQAIRLMDPGVEQWVWFCDFVGFGLVDADPRIAKEFLNLAANHYPERLGCFIVVDAPRIFSMMWAAIKPIVDVKTKEKIVFLPYNSKDSSQFDKDLQKQNFGPELREWVSVEMRDNRKRGQRKKVYCYENLLDVAQSSTEESPPSHYGTCSLLRLIAEQPHLIKPDSITN